MQPRPALIWLGALGQLQHSETQFPSLENRHNNFDFLCSPLPGLDQGRVQEYQLLPLLGWLRSWEAWVPWLHFMPLWAHNWQSSKFFSLPPLTPAPGAYVISALIEPPDWRVGGEFGPWRSHAHLTPVREHPRDPELQGSPEGETETQRGFPICPALRRELRRGVFQATPLWTSPVQAEGGRGSGRLPCAPRGRVGRGKAGVLLRQQGPRLSLCPAGQLQNQPKHACF